MHLKNNRMKVWKLRKALPIIFYTIFGISTTLLLIILFKDIDNSFSYKFIVFYVVFLLLFFIYFIIVMVIEMRKLKWSNIRKRLYKFISYFLILSAISMIYNYFFNIEMEYYEVFSIPLGVSLGISFFDLVIFRKSK